MNNIIEFKSKSVLNQYLLCDRGVNFKNRIGSGSEGACYISKNSDLAYKILDFYKEDELNPKNIITSKDIELNSFAFPITLFSVNNILEGYTAKYIKNDLIRKIGDDISFINFEALIKAYYKMKKDVEKLSDEHIKIIDLYNNLLFDGKSLVGIDTCYYSREDGNLIDKNFSSLDYAVKSTVSPFLIYNDYEIDENLDVEQYFKVLKKDCKSKKVVRYW